MEFQVGDNVVGNENRYLHRVGKFGTVTSVGENGTRVTWSDGETMEARQCGLDLVSRATPPQEPAKPRKMHPDDFMLAVSEFAADNGFGVTQLDFFSKEFVGSALPQHSYSV